jgi:hypothetical protein
MRRFCILSLALCSLASSAKADLIVDVGSLNLPVGQSGIVDVTIRSTGNDLLDTFGGEFQISTLGGTQLEFVSPPTDTQLSDPGYLFAGDSAAALIGPPAGIVQSNGSNNNTYLGGDGTLSGNGVAVPGVATLLLHLLVTASTASPPQAGDVFTISLIPGPSTFFVDPSFSSIPVISNPGTVTITASTVPEPTSLLVWAFGGLVTAGAMRRRRLGGHSTTAEAA